MPMKDTAGIFNRKQESGFLGLQGVPTSTTDIPANALDPVGGFVKGVGDAVNESTKTGGVFSPENLGSMAGAAQALPAAAALGLGPFGAAALGVGGAMLGGMGGRQVERLDPRNAPSQEGVVEGLANAANRQGLGHMIGGLAGGAVNKGIDVLSNGLVKTGQAAVDAVQGNRPKLEEVLNRNRIVGQAEARDFPLSLGQETGKPSLIQAESTPARFVFGADAAKEFADRQTQAGVGMLDKFGGGRSLESMGIANRNARQAAYERAQSNTEKQYELIGKTIPENARVTLYGVAEMAKAVTDPETVLGTAASRSARVGATVAGIAEKNDSRGIAENIIDRYNLRALNKFNWEELDTLRKYVNAQYAKAQTATDKANMSKLLAGIDADMSRMTDAFPGASQALASARAYAKENVIIPFHNNEAAQMLQNADPSEIVTRLIKPGASIEDIRRGKAALTPEAWQETTKTWIDNVVQRVATDPKSIGLTAGEATMPTLNRIATYFGPKNFPPEVLNEIFDPKIFGPQHAQNFSEVMDIIRLVTGSGQLAENSSNTGRSILGAGQLLAGANLFLDTANALISGSPISGASVMGTVATFALPEVLAKALLSPEGIKLLKEGLSINPASRDAAKQATSIATALISRLGVGSTRSDTPGSSLSVQDLLAAQNGSQPVNGVLNGYVNKPLRRSLPNVGLGGPGN